MTWTARLVFCACSAIGVNAAVPTANSAYASEPPHYDVSQYKSPVEKGTAVARLVESTNKGWLDQYSVAEVTTLDAKGKVGSRRQIQQTFLEAEGGNKSLIRFLSPPGVRGVSVLVHEHPSQTDESWVYLPSSRRTRRIAGANRSASFQGTEFTYEDMSTFQASRYNWEYEKSASILSEEKSRTVHVVKATPLSKDSGYGYIRMYVDAERMIPLRSEYYDKSLSLLKILDASEWKKFHGKFWRGHVLDMKNVQTKKRTRIQIKTLAVDLSQYRNADGEPRKSLDASAFTKRALERR